MKIKKATIFKFVAAAVIPGGFIIWGLHELSKLVRGGVQTEDVRGDSIQTEASESSPNDN